MMKVDYETVAEIVSLAEQQVATWCDDSIDCHEIVEQINHEINLRKWAERIQYHITHKNVVTVYFNRTTSRILCTIDYGPDGGYVVENMPEGSKFTFDINDVAEAKGNSIYLHT